MSYETIFEALDSLDLGQYKAIIQDNFLTDEVFMELLDTGLITEQLKEIIPPLAHRLLVVKKMNQVKEASSFQSHDVTPYQSPETITSDDGQVKCKLCHINIEYKWESVWNHLKSQHNYTTRKLKWDCLICPQVFTYFNSFKLHFKRHIMHEQSVLTEEAEEEAEKELAMESDTLELEIDPSQFENLEQLPDLDLEEEISLFQDRAVQFIINLKSSGRLPLSTCQEIMKAVNELYNSMLDISVKVTVNHFNTSEKVQLLDRLRNPFSTVSTDYKIEKYLKEKSFLFPPEEVVLGSKIKFNNGKAKVKYDTIQCISINKILAKVLSMPGVMKSISQVNCSTSNGVYKSAVSGAYLKSKLISEVPVILLLFYFDEVEVCNPLGSRHGIHKLGNCYFSILNMPQQYMSKLENIYLCCCFESILLNIYPMATILKPTVDALAEIFRNGLIVNSEFYSGKVEVKLGQVTGDNLGLHQLLGFSESFNSNFPCRFCKMPKYKCLRCCRDNHTFRRNLTNYNHDIQLNQLSKTGIKSESILNEIPSFHVTDNYCPDVMHDILEGVAPLDIKLVLGHLIQHKNISLENINHKIISHNYGSLQKDRPSPLSLRSIEKSDTLLGQSAGQTYCLLQNLTFMFGHMFDSSDLVWELLLTLLDIMDIIMSPIVSESTLPQLSCLIEDHHFIYQHITNRSLRPKHHHMLHYAEAIRQIGPLRYYWTIRFEARHKFFKHVAKIGSNFKNIAKTVSSRNQLHLAYKFLKNESFEQWQTEIPETSCIGLDGIKQDIKDVIMGIVDYNANTLLSTVNKVTVNGNILKLGDILLRCWAGESEFPEFSKIEMIVYLCETVWLIVREFKTKHFVCHYHAYALQETNDIKALRFTDFDLLKSLLHYHGTDDLMVALPFVSIILHVEDESGSSQSSILIPVEKTPFVGNPLPQRIRKRKLFHDDESDILDIRQILLNADKEHRTPVGSKIIETSEQRQPLPPNLRKKLVQITCLALMRKTNSNRPSTDQRQQLSLCIVDQLFSYMSPIEKEELKQSYFTPSTTYSDSNGKRISKTCMGYISSYFRNFWQANKEARPEKLAMDLIGLDTTSDNITEEELSNIQEWLKINRNPPAKVFEKLNQSFHSRKAFLKSCTNFEDVVEAWPRLFDIDSAIQNDFSKSFALAAEKLSDKWSKMAPKLIDYAAKMKKIFSTIGISDDIAARNVETAALFMLPFLIRPKNRNMTQLQSVEAFINVQNEADVEALARSKEVTYPEVLVIGRKYELLVEDVFVLFKGKATKCSTILEAVDLAFKSFYVFNIEFPSNCFGAYQFLDYCVYRMKQTKTVLSSVKELSAFASVDD